MMHLVLGETQPTEEDQRLCKWTVSKGPDFSLQVINVWEAQADDQGSVNNSLTSTHAHTHYESQQTLIQVTLNLVVLMQIW